jgi:heat shock protein HslJ
MKNMMLLPLALALAACTQNPAPGPASPAPSPGAAPEHAVADTATLGGHHWRLESANDAGGARIDALFPGDGHVLTLAFADGRVSVSGGCNGQGGRYAVGEGGKLEIGQLMSTQKACAAPLMDADHAVGKLLAQPLQWRVEAGSPPRLHLVSADGSTTAWTGEATAEARYGGPGETVFMEVAPRRIACSHPMIPDYKCLQVREIRYDANGVKQPPGEWQAFYGDIEGFEFREGERKVLRLKKFTRPEPLPADASSIAYVLDMVVESERVP